MRIIAGEFRSRALSTPAGMDTRPTSDRLRETLFNVLQSRFGGSLAGMRFLDLYAGSGANAFEALSRGARDAVLVEKASPAIAAIQKNATAFDVKNRIRLEATTVMRWLENAGRSGRDGAFDIVFLDPPYDEVAEYAATLDRLGKLAPTLLEPEGVVLVEHRRERPGKTASAKLAPIEPLRDRYGVLTRFRTLTQGEAALSLYQAAAQTRDEASFPETP